MYIIAIFAWYQLDSLYFVKAVKSSKKNDEKRRISWDK